VTDRFKAFKSSAWDEGDYIVSGIAPDQKPWADTPLGGVLGKDQARVVAEWLNGLSQKEQIALSKLFAILGEKP
jgi:hypothetical protein